MTGRIGKWALILGAIVNLLIFLMGILFDYDLLPTIPIKSLYYPFLISIPIVSSLLCLFLGWICVKVSKKETTQAINENNITVFFKSYLYVWVVVATLIFIFGFVFLDFRITLSRVVLVSTILNGIIWIATVIVCVLIWAAFNAWKNSEVIGVIIALIALIILVGTLTVVGLLYKEGENHEYDNYDYSSYYEEDVPVEEVYEGDYTDDYEEGYDEPDYDYDSEDKYDLAYRFFKYRLDIENTSDPVELVRSWKEYSWMSKSNWGEEEYNEELQSFRDANDFFKSKSYFYYIYDELLTNNNKISSLANHYLNGWDMSIDAYQKSGAKVCVKLLLEAHDVIYSHSNRDKILEEMYDIMCEEIPENDLGDDMVSYRYPKLFAYMSPQMQEYAKGLGGDWTTAWNERLMSSWAYSFWARRYKDGVDKGAYKVLKVIDKFYN